MDAFQNLRPLEHDVLFVAIEGGKLNIGQFRGDGHQLLIQSVQKALTVGQSSADVDVIEEVSPNVHVSLVYSVQNDLVQSRAIGSHQMGVEGHLAALGLLISQDQRLSIGQGIHQFLANICDVLSNFVQTAVFQVKKRSVVFLDVLEDGGMERGLEVAAFDLEKVFEVVEDVFGS